MIKCFNRKIYLQPCKPCLPCVGDSQPLPSLCTTRWTWAVVNQLFLEVRNLSHWLCKIFFSVILCVLLPGSLLDRYTVWNKSKLLRIRSIWRARLSMFTILRAVAGIYDRLYLLNTTDCVFGYFVKVKQGPFHILHVESPFKFSPVSVLLR